MSRRRNRRNKENGNGGDERWMVTYADMITLLLAFFIILYAMSEVEKTKFNSLIGSVKTAFAGDVIIETGMNGGGSEPGNIQLPQAEAPLNEQEDDEDIRTDSEVKLDQLKTSLLNYIGANNLEEMVELEDTPRGVQIIVKERILFDSGKAGLKEEADPVLTKVSGLLQAVDNDVSIEGHTDDRPIHTSEYESNWELSTDRALSVLRFFTEERKLAPERFQAVGHGEYKPRAPNDTPENRSENRRVTLVILR